MSFHYLWMVVRSSKQLQFKQVLTFSELNEIKYTTGLSVESHHSQHLSWSHLLHHRAMSLYPGTIGRGPRTLYLHFFSFLKEMDKDSWNACAWMSYTHQLSISTTNSASHNGRLESGWILRQTVGGAREGDHHLPWLDPQWIMTWGTRPRPLRRAMAEIYPHPNLAPSTLVWAKSMS